MPNATCDVVIATRNRPEALRRCLEGLRNQSRTDFGVIIVDDASDPPVVTYLDEAAYAGLDVRVVTLEGQSGPATGRNAGVAASDADYIVFVDDDILPDRHMIATHLETVTAAAGGDVPAVSFGPFVEPADWKPTPWNYWEAQAARKEAEALTGRLYTPTWRQYHTGNNCLPRELFLRAGGFDPEFKRAEDDEFAYRLHRLGCRFVFRPEAIAWHYAERSLHAWLSIPRAYAHFDVRMARMHPESGVLNFKCKELGRRHVAIRWVRSALRTHRLRVGGVAAATAAGRLLFRAGLRRPSVRALSLAYDLAYVDALAEELDGNITITGQAVEVSG